MSWERDRCLLQRRRCPRNSEEARSGSGYRQDIKAVDLASAYPYVMYHLPDISRGTWIEGDIQSEWWEWVEQRRPYTPGFAEAVIRFGPGMDWHPLVQKSSVGTLVSPRYIKGWFTADEKGGFFFKM